MTQAEFRAMRVGDLVQVGGDEWIAKIQGIRRDVPREYIVRMRNATKDCLIIEADCASMKQVYKPERDGTLRLHGKGLPFEQHNSPSDPVGTKEEIEHKAALAALPDDEFDTFMVKIDEALRDRDIPIFARELQAIPELFSRYRFPIGLHEPLVTRMWEWFRHRYGDRLKADLSLGYLPIVVKGDIYKVRVPPLWVGGQVVCLARPVTSPTPTINVLDLVDALPDSVRTQLDTGELARIRAAWMRAYSAFRALTKTRNESEIGSAHTDLGSAVERLVQDRPEVGLSRWSSLQAAEKYLKGWIKKSGSTFRFTHELVKTAQDAEALGLPPVSRPLLEAIQCKPDVRYDSTGLTLESAVAAFNATLELCEHIATSWPV